MMMYAWEWDSAHGKTINNFFFFFFISYYFIMQSRCYYLIHHIFRFNDFFFVDFLRLLGSDRLRSWSKAKRWSSVFGSFRAQKTGCRSIWFSFLSFWVTTNSIGVCFIRFVVVIGRTKRRHQTELWYRSDCWHVPYVSHCHFFRLVINVICTFAQRRILPKHSDRAHINHEVVIDVLRFCSRKNDVAAIDVGWIFCDPARNGRNPKACGILALCEQLHKQPISILITTRDSRLQSPDGVNHAACIPLVSTRSEWIVNREPLREENLVDGLNRR